MRRAAELVALAVVLSVAATARAGDRRLEVVFSNVTPDAQSSAASKACVRAIEKYITAAYTEVTRVGETALRKRGGKSAAGVAPLDWPAPALTAGKRAPKTRDGEDQREVDALILVDCRPEARTLDAVVHPASGEIVRVQLRRVAIDAAVATWIAESILGHAWSGFSP